ncbi:hypothetical protein D9619_012214 [Psilocybe cf. subviscida]|uniref:Uncharacterized protein n=1 Tax=Psilocybe cf. subviscida TaxID=2480587 RepID=A0A8H5B7D1_9AGAR|nr:hypothetical protein D9619_012214 [Psilocybe cf. subviscida]
MIHTFLMEAVATGNVAARLKMIATSHRRKLKVMSMREELLYLLQQIERNEDADVLSSLNAALDCPNL